MTALLASPTSAASVRADVRTVVLLGNPNSGKTTLFNALTGLRAQTANFAGTTVERRSARLRLGGRSVDLVDLPGLYSLRAATPDEQIARDMFTGQAADAPKPDLGVVVVDATNLERNLFLVSQALEFDVPLLVALNMVDLADRHGKQVDAATLASELGIPVVPVVARTGQGVPDLVHAIEAALNRGEPGGVVMAGPPPSLSACGGCSSCPFQARFSWTEQVAVRCTRHHRPTRSPVTDRLDAVLTAPVLGVAVFLVVMLGVFWLIFSAARIPMELIDGGFAAARDGLAGLWPTQGPAWLVHDARSLVVDGILRGVSSILVFLPQICILFFLLALLDDSGYLARAAFVMDRLMRRVGLPGTAFVPLLSAHACAIPAIMATRVIRDRRDRLLTILVLPLTTCSARIPVYTLVVALLFPDAPLTASLVFAGAYALGIVAALAMAWVLRRGMLRGESQPLVLELPGYRTPSLRNALLLTFDRATVFVRQAGTVIFVASMILWALASFPRSPPPARAEADLARAAAMAETGQTEAAEALAAQAGHEIRRAALEASFAGRIGKAIEPVVAPLGFDWQIGIGILSSFAAREVIVATLSIVYGLGEDGADDLPRLATTLRTATRSDGTPLFTLATGLSLLVFYVLAMQCLPTQAVTRRETGTWLWPAFQVAYMTALAYLGALVTYQVARWFGG